MKKRLNTLCILFFAAILFFCPSALAAEADNAGNLFASDAISTASIPRDLYWAGSSLNLSGTQIGGDAIIAGNILNLEKIHTTGSVRIAGNMVTLSGITVDNNITAAGNNVSISNGTKASGVYAAGSTISFDGECQAMSLSGKTVTLNGKVNGNATIDAEQVVIGDNAVVTGKLTVNASEKPDVPSSASIGSLSYTQNQNQEETEAADTPSQAAKTAKHAGYWLASTVALAAFLILLANKALEGAKTMTVQKPAPLFVSGLVGLLALPVLLILLLITYIGVPIAFIVALPACALGLSATAFAGASLGRLVFPKWNLWGSSLLGAAVLSLVENIPILGFIVTFAALIYTFGWVIQWIWEQIKHPDWKKTPAPAAESGEREVPTLPKDTTGFDNTNP